mgnify:CR=1 FL=1
MARRTRNRSEIIARRFVSRQQPTRMQPFVERWRWIIQGHVQGVGFRASCSRRALDMGPVSYTHLTLPTILLV